MRRADFCRREQTRRRRVAHVPKLSQDGFKAEGEVTGDVFEEHPLGVAFTDDACDIWPEMARVVGATALSSCTKRLAGISGEDDVEGAAKGAGIEATEIIPDRGWREIPSALGRDEYAAGPIVPLDKSAGVIAGLGEHDAQIEASAACAEGQSVPGT